MVASRVASAARTWSSCRGGSTADEGDSYQRAPCLTAHIGSGEQGSDSRDKHCDHSVLTTQEGHGSDGDLVGDFDHLTFPGILFGDPTRFPISKNQRQYASGGGCK